MSGSERIGMTRYQKARANAPTSVRTQNFQPTVSAAMIRSIVLIVSELSHKGIEPPYSGKRSVKKPWVA